MGCQLVSGPVAVVVGFAAWRRVLGAGNKGDSPASSPFTACGLHAPPEHTSGDVQALLSLQPMVLATCAPPVAASQLAKHFRRW